MKKFKCYFCGSFKLDELGKCAACGMHKPITKSQDLIYTFMRWEEEWK
jgi:predicted ATP-dependent serine protease